MKYTFAMLEYAPITSTRTPQTKAPAVNPDENATLILPD